MNEMVLPWQSGLWEIADGYGVSYDGDHVFHIFGFGEAQPIPQTGESPLDADAVREFVQINALTDTDDFSHTVEAVRFMGLPSILSVFVAPAEGPADEVFVQLFFDRNVDNTQWAYLWASNHEWDTIDPRAVAAFAPIFREFVATHSDGPTPSTPDRGAPDRYDILFKNPPGSFCRDLYAGGFSYRHAVAYWLYEGMPDRLDADLNGVPCETVYPAFAVEMVYKPPTWPDIEIATNVAGDGTRTFAASGSAVTTGVVCSAGTVEEVEVGEWGWRDRYTCDDESGSFYVTLESHLAGEGIRFTTWVTGTPAGNAAYEWLDAGGGAVSTVTQEGVREDHLRGRANINPAG